MAYWEGGLRRAATVCTDCSRPAFAGFGDRRGTLRGIIAALQKLGLAAFRSQRREPRADEEGKQESREDCGMWYGWTWDLVGIQA